MKWIVISIALLLAAGAFAWSADSGDPTPATRTASPVPMTFGDGTAAIRVSADRIARRRADALWVLELSGGVRVQQGEDVLTAENLIGWFKESGDEAGKVGVLDLYGEADAMLFREGKRVEHSVPALVRLASPTGLVLDGRTVSEQVGGEPTDLYARAEAYRTAGPEALQELVSNQQLMTVIHPSAHEMIIEQTDEHNVVLTLHGNARIVYEDMVLSADTLRAYVHVEQEKIEEIESETTRIERIYAEGVVDVVRGADRITADALIIDVDAGEALATSARVRTRDQGSGLPLQFYAETIRQRDPNTFETEGPGYVTASEFAVPHYRMEGRKVRLVRGPPQEETAGEEPSARRILVSSSHNILYIGPVPVFYWPYLARDLSSTSFVLEDGEVGTSSNMGAFTMLTWNLYDLGLLSDESSDLLLRTDYFSDRGLGTGLNFTYETPGRHGFAQVYYINDTASEDDRDLPTPQNNRGEATLRHREYLTCLPEGWHLDLELGYLSDRQFLRTYDRDAYDKDKDRETQVFLSGASGTQLFTAQARTRINDFQNTVDRQAATYHVIGQPLFDTGVILTSHVDLANMKQRLDNDLAMSDGESVRRVDAAVEMSRPVQLGFIRMDPYVWGDATSYSNQVTGGSTLRTAGAFGARAAANFYRTYFVQNESLDVNRLRHVITPTAEYRNQFSVSDDPEDLYQGDEIDALDRLHRVSVGLRNRFQTYRKSGGDRPVDFVVLDIDYASYLRDSGADRGMDDYLEFSGTWLATEHISFNSIDNRYNIDDDRMEAFNTEVRFDLEPPVSLAVGNKYYVDLSDASEPSHWISRFDLGFEPKFSRWRVDTYVTYDFKSHDRPEDTKDPSKLGSGITFTRNVEGWLLGLAVEFNQGRANETRFSLHLTPPTRRR